MSDITSVAVALMQTRAAGATVEAFTDVGMAIEWARATAKEFDRFGDLREENEFGAAFSIAWGESDSITVYHCSLNPKAITL